MSYSYFIDALRNIMTLIANNLLAPTNRLGILGSTIIGVLIIRVIFNRKK